MDDDSLGFDVPTGVIEQQLSVLREQLDRLQLRTAVDPDGELSATDRMLRMKRGSRR